jgi:predicted cupin superfamily sugar epimerase
MQSNTVKNEMLTPQQLIRHFDLKPLPVEGGFFTQSYRATDTLPQHVLPSRYSSARSFGSAIFYLLTPDPDVFSALHRLPTDEIYHFYLGDPVEMLLLHPDGTSQRVILGQDILNGQNVQFAVPHGVWQGSHLIAGGRFALMGTTMAPGYDNSDFIGGERAVLQAQYPDQAELISQLTRIVAAAE